MKDLCEVFNGAGNFFGYYGLFFSEKLFFVVFFLFYISRSHSFMAVK